MLAQGELNTVMRFNVHRSVDRYINISEASKLFRISKSTFCRWQKTGIVPSPAIKKGRVRLWKRDALVRAVEGSLGAHQNSHVAPSQTLYIQHDDGWSQPEL